MSLGKVPIYECRCGAKRNAILELGAQLSTVTQRVATTTRHCHTEKLSGDTCQPLYSPKPAKEGGWERHGDGQTTTQTARFGGQKNCTTSRVSACHLKLCKTCLSNKCACSMITTSQRCLVFN